MERCQEEQQGKTEMLKKKQMQQSDSKTLLLRSIYQPVPDNGNLVLSLSYQEL
jgi:hypothetical protein